MFFQRNNYRSLVSLECRCRRRARGSGVVARRKVPLIINATQPRRAILFSARHGCLTGFLRSRVDSSLYVYDDLFVSDGGGRWPIVRNKPTGTRVVFYSDTHAGVRDHSGLPSLYRAIHYQCLKWHVQFKQLRYLSKEKTLGVLQVKSEVKAGGEPLSPGGAAGYTKPHFPWWGDAARRYISS